MLPFESADSTDRSVTVVPAHNDDVQIARRLRRVVDHINGGLRALRRCVIALYITDRLLSSCRISAAIGLLTLGMRKLRQYGKDDHELSKQQKKVGAGSDFLK